MRQASAPRTKGVEVGEAMRFRGNTVRRKIVALLMVPLLALISLWGVATYHTGTEAKQILDARGAQEKLSEPLERTIRTIQLERRQSVAYRADPRRSDALAQLRRHQRATDQAVRRLDQGASAVRGKMTASVRERVEGLLSNLSGINSLRENVEGNTVSRENTLAGFSDILSPSFELLTQLRAIKRDGLDRQARGLSALTLARETVSQEDALVAGSLAAGRVTAREFRALSDRIAERRLSYEGSFEVLPASESRVYEEYWSGPDGKTLLALESEALGAGAQRAATVLNADRWDSATAAVLVDLQELEAAALERYADRVAPVERTILIRAGLVAVLGFVAVLVSILVSFRVGRRLVRDLVALRKEAHEAASVRLPSVLRRLAAGERIDVETETPRLEYGRDEIGQVGHALSTLHRAAIEGAVKQADMRRGVSEVFVNLARRSQVLLHRQLNLLDTMERRTEDSEELADLFRLDHLTTRMRRHAEGLVILSGATPSRQWRKPVQFMDVVRAAVAEVEDYERVEVRRLPKLAVDGPAVADLTHLVAELLENATVFSPPHTAVQVQGERVANGVTLEIHDRGLGMKPDALLEANLRLAETPEFELSDTDRLGLFVVSRLAQRQGVRVSLQPSPYGGTTAVVLVPGTILNESSEAAPEALERGRTTGPSRSLTPALAQRLALGTRQGEEAARSSGQRFRAPNPLPPQRSGHPVELDSALEELEEPDDSIGRLFRGRGLEEGGTRSSRHGGDQHQQAGEEFEQRGGARPTREEGTGPLPRRQPGTHGGPVLVSDHGRPVGQRTSHRLRPAPDPEEKSGSDATERTGAGDAVRTAEKSTPGGDQPRQPSTLDGLPRRVRQASLAPQLKTPGQSLESGKSDKADTESAAEAASGTRSEERDPDEVRDRMASLQRGWQRGRQHNDGTTPEGNGR